MPEYSESPEIESIVLDLRHQYQLCLGDYEADPSPENREALDIAATAFANARTSALNRQAVPVIGGDAVQDGVN
jgi:hypothetical protein